MSKEIFDELEGLTTESRNPRTRGIDLADTGEVLRLLNAEDRKVAEVVGECIPSISDAVELVLAAFREGGRLFYLGAGTSGRLGVLDAAECPPTFGTEPSMVQGIIAGGYETLIRSREGVEDDTEAVIEALERAAAGKRDVVIGITASRRTPFVIAGLEEARSRGARTIFITCNSKVAAEADVVITAVVGPEALTGSTRLKAGSAQKMILNMITTTAMIRMGKAFENLMVDLRPTSRKLIERSKRIIMLLTGASYDEAADLLERSKHNVKAAVIMARLGMPLEVAERALADKGGFLRAVLEDPPGR